MNVRNSFLALILAVAILFPCVALAVSDISDAGYLGEIEISNNSTVAYDVSANFTANTTSLIATGMLNATASDAAMRDANGNDVLFMPGYDGNPWITFIDEIGADATITHYLYTCNVTGGEYRYFPGPGGMTVSDDATLELGDNFTVTTKGFIDTTAVGDNITSKEDALRTYVSASGNVTATFPSTTDTDIWQSSYDITVDIGGGASYSRVAQRYDDFPRANITSASFYITQSGSPTGTAYARIRKVSDDSIIGTLGEIDVSTISVFPTFTLYDFNTSSVLNSYKQDIRITLEYTGGDASNHIKSRYYETDVVSGQYSRYTGSWANLSYADFTHKLSYEGIDITVTIPDLSSGEYELEVKSDGSFFGIGANATTADFPISDNLTFNAPLYHADLNGATFTTKDTNGYTCTVTGAAWTENGYYFGGDGDVISHTCNLSASADFSIGCWVYVEDNMTTGQTSAVFDFRSGSLRGIGIDAYHNGYYQYKMREPGGTISTLETASPYFDMWVFIIGTFDYSENLMTLYVDGSYSDSTSGQPATASTGQSIGGHNVVSGNAVDFQGYIGDTFLYSSLLSADDALELYNATAWKYNGSSEAFHYQYSGGASVPDNSNGWVFFSGDAVSYMEYTEVEVAGVQKGYWEWEYAATFADQSGNSNTATPTFRTDSSDADVSAELISFAGAKGTTNPPASGGTGWTMVTDVPTGPDSLLSELDMSFLGAGYIVTFCESTDIPLALVVFPYAFGTAIILGAIAWYLSSGGGKHPHGRGSLLAMAAVSLLVMVYFVYSGDGVIPAWVIIPFALEALAFIVWRQTPSPY